MQVLCPAARKGKVGARGATYNWATRKNPLTIPLYWLFTWDPYIGIIIIPTFTWIVPLYTAINHWSFSLLDPTVAVAVVFRGFMVKGMKCDGKIQLCSPHKCTVGILAHRTENDFMEPIGHWTSQSLSENLTLDAYGDSNCYGGPSAFRRSDHFRGDIHIIVFFARQIGSVPQHSGYKEVKSWNHLYIVSSGFVIVPASQSCMIKLKVAEIEIEEQTSGLQKKR